MEKKKYLMPESAEVLSVLQQNILVGSGEGETESVDIRDVYLW